MSEIKVRNNIDDSTFTLAFENGTMSVRGTETNDKFFRSMLAMYCKHGLYGMALKHNPKDITYALQQNPDMRSLYTVVSGADTTPYPPLPRNAVP